MDRLFLERLGWIPMNRAILVLTIVFELSYGVQVSLGQATVQLTPPSRQTSCTGSMVLVHGGTMQMGVDTTEVAKFQKFFGIDIAQLSRDEIPKHTVTVHDFYMDTCPVSNAEFKKFTDANPEWKADRIPSHLDNGNYLKHWKLGVLTKEPDHPVVNVNWYAAVAYCRWAGKRLPTEAEWEYAARGGVDAIFPWGDQPVDGSRANFSGSGLGATSPVGKYPPNAYGLFDMAGNVWQFLADEWKPYPSTAQVDPIAGGDFFLGGPGFLEVRTRRVIRGGSFDGAPINLWIQYRDSHPPNGSRGFVGFRCAK